MHARLPVPRLRVAHREGHRRHHSAAGHAARSALLRGAARVPAGALRRRLQLERRSAVLAVRRRAAHLHRHAAGQDAGEDRPDANAAALQRGAERPELRRAEVLAAVGGAGRRGRHPFAGAATLTPAIGAQRNNCAERRRDWRTLVWVGAVRWS